MIDIQGNRGTQMDVQTAIFQLDALISSIAAEAEVQYNSAGVQQDIERYVANAAYYVREVLEKASETKDPLRFVIVQLHRDINAANSALVWKTSEWETRDADARIFVYVSVMRKARVLAGMCGTIKTA